MGSFTDSIRYIAASIGSLLLGIVFSFLILDLVSGNQIKLHHKEVFFLGLLLAVISVVLKMDTFLQNIRGIIYMMMQSSCLILAVGVAYFLLTHGKDLEQPVLIRLLFLCGFSAFGFAILSPKLRGKVLKK